MSTTPRRNRRNVVLNVIVTEKPLRGSTGRPPSVEKKLIILDRTELETLVESLLESSVRKPIDADNQSAPDGANHGANNG